MLRLLLTFVLFFTSLLTLADELVEKRKRVLNDLWQAFDENKNTLDNLHKIQQAVNDRLMFSTIQYINKNQFPSFGRLNAPLVIEFSDYQCPYCQQSYKALHNLVKQGAIQVVVIELPILGQLSTQAAHYALLAWQQQRYADFHHSLMSRPDAQLNTEQLSKVVIKNNLDLTALDEQKINEAINHNYQLANLLNIKTTPTFVIGNIIVTGALSEDEIKILINKTQN